MSPNISIDYFKNEQLNGCWETWVLWLQNQVLGTEWVGAQEVAVSSFKGNFLEKIRCHLHILLWYAQQYEEIS